MQPKLPWPWNELLAETANQRLGGPMGLPDAIRGRHSLTIGATGSGKSRLIESLAVLDALRRVTGHSKSGYAIIDNTGDLTRNMRVRLAALSQQYPAINELLYIFDPTHQWSARVNPLQLYPGDVAEQKADNLAHLITTVFHEEPTTVVRMYRVSYHTFLALSLAKRSLVDVPQFLTDRAFRERIVSSLNHAELNQYFLTEFPAQARNGSEREALAMVESTLNRLGRFVALPAIAAMFGGPATVNIRELMDMGAIVLVNAPKGVLGEGASALLCAFLISAFEQAGYSRQHLADHERTQFYLICDEFTAYMSEAMIRIIAQSRKYGLSLSLVTQEVAGNPKTEPLIRSVINTVQSIFSFRLSDHDAQVIVRELFTPPLNQPKEVKQRRVPTGIKWFPYTTEQEIVWTPMQELYEQEIRRLTQLPDRMVWWKQRGQPGAHLIRTLSVANIEDLPNAQALPGLLLAQEMALAKRAGVAKQGSKAEAKPRKPLLLLPGTAKNGKDDDDTLDYSEFFDV